MRDKRFMLIVMFILGFSSRAVLRYLRIESGNTGHDADNIPHSVITKIVQHSLPRPLTTHSAGNRHPQVRKIPTQFCDSRQRTSGKEVGGFDVKSLGVEVYLVTRTPVKGIQDGARVDDGGR